MKFYIAETYQIDGPGKPINVVTEKINVGEDRFRQLLTEELTAVGCVGEKLQEVAPKLTEAVFRRGIGINKHQFTISGKGEFKPFE